jgi:hypothetical protein
LRGDEGGIALSSDQAFSHSNAGLAVVMSISRYARGEGEWLIDVGGVDVWCSRLVDGRATIAARWLYLTE